MDKYEILKTYFGHRAFRPGQETIIDAILGGRDALGIMPTGGGKSLCYQVPALGLRGLAVVVSPLISLMRDQVMALKDAGVDAAYLNSSLTGAQIQRVYRNLYDGQYKILYVAPERLGTEGFCNLAQRLPISLLAVDEAHCISQWGQDFRPSYLQIVDFLEALPTRPVVAAFTATATEAVRRDIQRILQLRDPETVITGFDRPNLRYEVRQPGNKSTELALLLADRRDQCGILYCMTRKEVERVCETLQNAGFAATRYHAGLSDGERRENQEDFIHDRKSVMVATNAFGMGIDKSNVSYVIHYSMPLSLEAYYQEAGRAGRDGSKADCILLYAPGDIQKAKFMVELPPENDLLTEEEHQRILKQDKKRLNDMIGYCLTTDCLRGYILSYFGQAHPEHCGNCGNCQTAFREADITREAQMILSCVRRIRDRLGYSVGAHLLTQTLRGSKDQRVLDLGLNQLTTYGLMEKETTRQVRAYIEQLENQGYLHTDLTYKSIDLTDQAREVLFRGRTVTMAVKEVPPAQKGRGKKEKPAPLPADDALFAVLRETRNELARKESLPAYIIFSNATLTDMAARAPETMEEFLEVSGVGEVKARRYGEAFLAAIAEYKSGTAPQ